MALVKRLKIENHSSSGVDFRGNGFKVYIPGNATGSAGITVLIPYDAAADNIAALQAIATTIVVTDLGVEDDGVPDEEVKNISIAGPPSVKGAANVVTTGSSTTITTTGNAFAKVRPGAAITANGATRYVKSKTNSNSAVVDGDPVDWANEGQGYSFVYKNPLVIASDNGTVRGYIRSDGVVFLVTAGGTIKLSQLAHITDAVTEHNISGVTEHTITDPADAPADADALREDLVTNVIPSIESALNAIGTSVGSVNSGLNALGTKINAILTRLEELGVNAAA